MKGRIEYIHFRTYKQTHRRTDKVKGSAGENTYFTRQTHKHTQTQEKIGRIECIHHRTSKTHTLTHTDAQIK